MIHQGISQDVVVSGQLRKGQLLALRHGSRSSWRHLWCDSWRPCRVEEGVDGREPSWQPKERTRPALEQRSPYATM